MKQILRLCSLLAAFSLLAGAGTAFGQQTLRIGNGSVQGLMVETVDVTMTTIDSTEGFVLAVCYNTTRISVLGFNASAGVLATPAELVSAEIFDAQGGCTLGVVLDSSAPFLGQEIPAGANTVIAHLNIMADVLVAVPEVVALTFCDGTLNNPILDNIIVQGGLSLGNGGGLSLVNGSIELLPPPPDQLYIENVNIPAGQTACARILLSSSSGLVQGFVLAIAHPAGLTLQDINILGTVTQAQGAEFVVPNEGLVGGGTLGVVMDFSAPFTNKTIGLGNLQHIANFCYRCDSHPIEPAPATCYELTFVDGVLGTPTLDNVIVVAGLSLNPGKNDAVNADDGAVDPADYGFACCQPVPAQDTMFACGTLDSEGNVVDVVGGPGDTVELCFFYKDATDNLAGFQLAVCFDCNLTFLNETFTVEGTIAGEVGAEFVNSNVNNNGNGPAAGTCEFVAGILLDALPPFNRQTVPQTAEFLAFACIQVAIDDNPLLCNTCLPITFCDGAVGAGQVPIENIVVAGTVNSIQNFATMPCNICVEAELEFVRGDCNNDDKTDIADASSILAHQFQGFVVDCKDACDANDDGKINLADSVYILNWQFKFGPVMPQPYPDQGPDTTDDDPSGLHVQLDCVNGRDPCLNP